MNSRIDEEDTVEKLDGLIKLISEWTDFLDHRLENDQMTFMLTFNINYGLITTIITFAGAAIYTIYEEVSEEFQQT